MTHAVLVADSADAFPLYRRFIEFEGELPPRLRANGADPADPDRAVPDWEIRDTLACDAITVGAFHAANERIQSMEFFAHALKDVFDGIYPRDEEAARTPRAHTIAAAASYNQAVFCLRQGGPAGNLVLPYAEGARSHLAAAVEDDAFRSDELYASVDRALTALEQTISRGLQ